MTSSRKNTPEKRTTEDIDHEIARWVQQEVKRLLSEQETNRQVESQTPNNQQYPNQMSNPVKGGTYQHIPSQVGRTQNLIGDYQCPPEMTVLNLKTTGREMEVQVKIQTMVHNRY